MGGLGSKCCFKTAIMSSNDLSFSLSGAIRFLSFIATLAHRAEERPDVLSLWHTVCFEEQLSSLDIHYDGVVLWIELVTSLCSNFNYAQQVH